ncbi:hypothetical protein SBRY_60583 [Actinacidiphila bryophytorum]|uniref:Uncharacterized protein n=1 Tax=Actinacidiphila bryophytorum TaxID=1436133 RepID=A0A9W4H663_9ACTN|nr:hypothetical protein SBRY_60583 [Actinacidiphila bryophytorum]
MARGEPAALLLGLLRRFQRREGADRRRRHPQRLRPHQRPGAARPDGAVRRERPGGHRGARAVRRHRDRADGHHDAGDGRLRHDDGDPQDAAVRGAADHRADREGHEGRPGEEHRVGSVGLCRQTGGHRPPADADGGVDARPLTKKS